MFTADHVRQRLLREDEPQSSALACSILRSVLQQRPFQQQPPEAQALLQACMKQLARQAGSWGLQHAALELLRQVPLLHAADYEHVLLLARAAGALILVHVPVYVLHLALTVPATRCPSKHHPNCLKHGYLSS